MTKLYNEVGINGRPYVLGQWREIAVHSDTQVLGFFGEYRFLSNTWPAKVVLDGITFPSVENAYKAWRWLPSSRGYLQTCTALEAIRYNRENQPDGPSIKAWLVVRDKLMYSLNCQKYNPAVNPGLYLRLQNTGNMYLAERNWWGDMYWGTDIYGNGENRLGKILMKIREIGRQHTRIQNESNYRE